MNKIEVLKIINKDIYTLEKAWGTLFHNKTYAVITGDRVEKFFKTKRGAEGYIKKNEGFSYYDDYFQELVSPHKNDFVIEILDSELTDLSTDKKLWYNYLKSNIQNIFVYHMGENIVCTAKHANVTNELLDYIETTIKDIEATESMIVIEEFAEDKVIEDVENETEPKQEIEKCKCDFGYCTEYKTKGNCQECSKITKSKGYTGCVFATSKEEIQKVISVDNFNNSKTFSKDIQKHVDNIIETIKELEWQILKFQYNENDGCIYADVKNKYEKTTNEGLYASSEEKTEIPQIIECLKYNYPTIEFETIEKIQEKEIHKDEIKTEIKPVSETTQQVINNTTIDNIEVRYNTDKNGIEVIFADKPSNEVLAQLKANGFRWSKYQKLWYTKDTQQRRDFIKNVLQVNTEGSEGNTITEGEKVINYPAIDINDIDTYTVSKELSKQENDGHWVFRTKERDHQKELQDYLQSCNDDIIKLIKNTDDKQLIYKMKSYLQYYKKAYYKNYMAQLRNDADNPSWITTGRDGRNKRKDNKAFTRHDNLMHEYISLTNQYKEKLQSFEWKIEEVKRKQEIKQYTENIKDIDISNIKFEKKSVKIDVGAVRDIFNNPTREVNAYYYNGYYIIKTWGRFRIYNKQGNEIEQTVHTGTLKNAKENLIFMLSNIQSNDIKVAEG